MTEYPDTPGYQKNSDTSAAAATVAQAGSEKQRQLIIAALMYRQANPSMMQGITIDEAAEVLSAALNRQVPPGTASARVRELEMRNKIHKTDTRRKTRTGCTATVYALGLKGRGEAGRIEAREAGIGRHRRTAQPCTHPVATEGGLYKEIMELANYCEKYGVPVYGERLKEILLKFPPALDKPAKPLVYGRERITPEQMAKGYRQFLEAHHPYAEVTEVRISGGQDVMQALREQAPKYEYGIDLASGPDKAVFSAWKAPEPPSKDPTLLRTGSACPNCGATGCPRCDHGIIWDSVPTAEAVKLADVVGIPVTQSALDKLKTSEALGGHGWVFPRNDGAQVCLGPKHCRKCGDLKKYKEAMERPK